MVLGRPSKLVAPLERFDRFLVLKVLDSLYKGSLAFLCSDSITSILCRVDTSMESFERPLQVRNETFRILTDFVLKLKNALSESLPIHLSQLAFPDIIIRVIDIKKAFG